jgi:hypothetical protein
MYSIALVLSLSAGGEAPAWWWNNIGFRGCAGRGWSAGYNGGFDYGPYGWGGEYTVSNELYGPYNPRGSPHEIIWHQPGDRVAVFSPGPGAGGPTSPRPSRIEGYAPETLYPAATPAPGMLPAPRP